MAWRVRHSSLDNWPNVGLSSGVLCPRQCCSRVGVPTGAGQRPSHPLQAVGDKRMLRPSSPGGGVGFWCHYRSPLTGWPRLPASMAQPHTCCLRALMVFRELFRILCSWIISHNSLGGTFPVTGDQKTHLTVKKLSLQVLRPVPLVCGKYAKLGLQRPSSHYRTSVLPSTTPLSPPGARPAPSNPTKCPDTSR